MSHELFCGMERRVALARAVALDPMMIMYDAPLTGQDPISLGTLVNLIHRMNEAMGMTTIVVSHDVSEAIDIADYVYLLFGGKVIEQGLPLKPKRSSSQWVQQFMQGLPDGPVPFHDPGIAFREDMLNYKLSP